MTNGFLSLVCLALHLGFREDNHNVTWNRWAHKFVEYGIGYDPTKSRVKADSYRTFSSPTRPLLRALEFTQDSFPLLRFFPSPLVRFTMAAASATAIHRNQVSDSSSCGVWFSNYCLIFEKRLLESGD